MNIPKDFMEQAIKNVLEEYGLTEDMSLKDCVEKQIAKKPIDRCMFKECPTCGSVEIEGCGYCPECGQKLDWSV